MNSPLELTSITIYLIVLLSVSLIFRRMNNSVSDYFRSGCKGTWWLVGSSLLVSSISAYTFTGNAGAVYQAGLSPLAIYAANVLAFLFLSFFLAGWFRQLRAITNADAIRMRYGYLTEQLTIYTLVPYAVCHSAFTLYGLSIFSSALLGLPVNWVIISLGLTVLVYSTFGGSWAVMATDFLQGLIMISITILVAVLALHKIGGVGPFIEAVSAEPDFKLFKAADAFEASKFTALWIFSTLLVKFIGLTDLGFSNRFFSAKDGREARRAALFGAVLMALGSFVWFIPPMVARLTMANEIDPLNFNNPAEVSYAVISRELLPNGMLGLMVITMFAATMSSMDSGLNRNAAVIVQNVIPPLFRKLKKPLPPDKTMLRVGKIATSAFGLLTLYLALYFSRQEGFSMFHFLLDLAVILGTPVAVPMLLGIYIRKVPSYAALVSWACGSTPAVAALISAGYFDHPWSYQARGLATVSCGVIGFFATMPFFKNSSPEYKQRVETFFETMHRPVDFEAEVGEGNDDTQSLTLGYASLIIGCLILPLLMISNPWTGRLGILFVSLFCMIVGGVMIFLTKRNSTR